MAKVEIEISDDTAADIAALRAAHPDWDDEKFWTIILHDGIDLTRHEDAQQAPEAVAAAQATAAGREAERERDRREWEAATLPEVVASAGELVGDGDAYGRDRPGRDLWLRLRLDNPQVRTFAWLELVRKARALRLPVAGLKADADNPEHQAAARAYVAALVHNDFHANWSALVWGQHALLYPDPAPDEKGSPQAIDSTSRDDIPF